MGTNDTAALVVAMEAKLDKFLKGMDTAYQASDRAAKQIEDRFVRLNGAVAKQMQGIGFAATSNIGLVGSILTSLGPAGVAAAVGIGTVVGGILALSNATDEYATKAKALKEAAETAGLTITQLKLLGSAGKIVGLDFDETSTFFTKFIANLAELRQGSGPLYDALLKVDVGLLRELSTTKDSAKAIDLLVAAYARLQDQTARLELSKAAGGKGGLSGGRLLDSLAGQGGLAGLQANSPAIDETQIERAAKLKTEIEEISRQTKNVWGSMFSDEILAHRRDAIQDLNDISNWLAKIITQTKSNIWGDSFNSRFAGDGTRPGLTTPGTPTNIGTTIHPAAAAQGTDSAPGSAAVELAILQKNIALLGDAVNQGEEWKKKRLEIAAAAEKGGLQDGVAQRALAAFNLVQRAAALAAQERYGVATEQAIVEVKLAQLEQDRKKGLIDANQVQLATVVIMREAKQAADALTVRQSYLPGLKQLELDAKDLRKGLDELSTSTLNNVTDGLADIVSGTKTVSDGFRDMATSIIRDLARIAIRQSITGPLASAIGGLFGGGTAANAFGNTNFNIGDLSYLGVGRNAGGTDNWRGGPTWVGEKGPEIVNLPRGAQVVPNNVVMGGGGGGVTNHVFAPNITITGAQAVTPDQLKAVLDQKEREFNSRVLIAQRDNVRRSRR